VERSFLLRILPIYRHRFGFCPQVGLRRLLSIPAGQVVSIARLKIDPVWDPLRNRLDFQQLLSGPEQIGPNK